MLAVLYIRRRRARPKAIIQQPFPSCHMVDSFAPPRPIKHNPPRMPVSRFRGADAHQLLPSRSTTPSIRAASERMRSSPASIRLPSNERGQAAQIVPAPATVFTPREAAGTIPDSLPGDARSARTSTEAWIYTAPLASLVYALNNRLREPDTDDESELPPTYEERTDRRRRRVLRRRPSSPAEQTHAEATHTGRGARTGVVPEKAEARLMNSDCSIDS